MSQVPKETTKIVSEGCGLGCGRLMNSLIWDAKSGRRDAVSVPAWETEET